jgi:chromatin structure-remodeling complex subunit RSC1/2
MYHQLTSPDPSNSSGHNFASVAAGPGNAKPLRSAESTNEDGVTSFRISSKERQFTELASFKGQTYRVGEHKTLSFTEV